MTIPPTTRSRGVIMTAGAVMAITLMTLIMLVACEKMSSPDKGLRTASALYIGPQPGPDRPLARPINPYAGNRAVLAEGRQLFNWYNCSGCHGDHGGGGMGPSLRDSTWYYGGDDASIFASITEGRQKGMPAWGTKLPADQIWKIVTYIKSMRTPDEPDPPR
jgi:cytochrome c oxidase cbb3-type subunit 3